MRLQKTLPILLMAISLSLSAQINLNKDRLYLRDGTVLVGEVGVESDFLNITIDSTNQIKKFNLKLVDKVVSYSKGQRIISKSVYLKKRNRYDLMKQDVVGKINLFSISIRENASINKVSRSEGTIRVLDYYYTRGDEREIKLLNLRGFGGLGFSLKKAKRFFEDCPVLVEKIKNKEFDYNSIKKLIVFYNNKCN